MTDARRPVLLDNTVLTNFALVGQDTLPTRLWSDAACTTTAVYGEYLAGAAAGILPAGAWRELIQVTPNEEEDTFAARLSAQLGTGERSCLAVAISRSGALASDDLLAWRWAREHGVEVTGTLGILLACIRRDYLTREQANTLLAAMIATGCRSPAESLDDLLKTDR